MNRTIAIAAASALSTASFASTLRVPASYPTIQTAIAAAASGDKIVVASGTYTENIDFLGKAISVIGQAGAQTTIINGGGIKPVVTFKSGETSAATLKGFTLTNGGASTVTSGSGAGIYISESNPTITNNIIQGNSAPQGAAIDIESASPALSGNKIQNNAGGGITINGQGTVLLFGNSIVGNSGTGIFMSAVGNPDIESNIIQNNTSAGAGGLAMFGTVQAWIVNNLIAANSGTTYGGVEVVVPPSNLGPTFANNTISGNKSASGPEVYLFATGTGTAFANNLVYATAISTALDCGMPATNTQLFLNNDIFSSLNGSPVNVDCGSLIGSNSNISANPLLVGGSSKNRYQLRKNSPAIDAGNNFWASGISTDLAGNPRVVDGNGDGNAVVDIGAYEYQ